jgi:hypothetical protein
VVSKWRLEGNTGTSGPTRSFILLIVVIDNEQGILVQSDLRRIIFTPGAGKKLAKMCHQPYPCFQ